MPEPAPHPRPRRRAAAAARHSVRFGTWVMSALFGLALLVGIATLVLSTRDVPLPGWAVDRIQTRVNAQLPRGQVDLGGVTVFIDRGGVPRVSLLDVGLRDNTGQEVARLDRVLAAFDPAALLLDGRIAPRSLTMQGAQISLRRAVDGSLVLSFGERMAFPGVAAVLDTVEDILAQPLFNRMDGAAIEDLSVSIEDARTGRVWQLVEGRLGLVNRADTLDLSLRAEVFNGSDDQAGLQVAVRSRRGDGRAAITVNVAGVAARDIALQAPALAVLAVLDAPISGALRAGLDQNGRLGTLAGSLDIGAGSLRPRAETAPLSFDTARAYFTYAPETQKITFSEIAVDSPDLSAEISGHAYLRDLSEQGFPAALVAQLRIDRLRASRAGLFSETLEFDRGAVDLRLRLNPFNVEIGQLVLVEPGSEGTTRRYAARGTVGAGAEGWRVALDLDAPDVPVARALALWPVPMAPKAREWLERNITRGTLYGVTGAFRKVPGARADLGATFRFRDARLQFLRDMPLLDGASGYASIIAQRFAVTLEAGSVTPPLGGPLDLTGSVLVVPDTRQKPSQGQFTLSTRGSMTAHLSLLDRPPLNILKNTPRGPDMAEGEAQMVTTLILPFQRGNKLADLEYASNGVLNGLRSETLIPGRMLEANELTVNVDPLALSVGGQARLDGVPVDARWRLGRSPAERGTSRLIAQVELSGQAAELLGIRLPAGLLSGQGSADVTVDLAAGQPPVLRLRSDLAGVGMGLGALGWSKPTGGRGSLEIDATLGTNPAVQRIALDAGGLQASGRIALAPGGGLERAVFDRVRLNGWLDAPVTLRGRGAGVPPAVTVSGGRLDFRRAGFGKGGGGAGAARGPVEIALDQLVMSEGITLTGFTGGLAAGRATNGRFTARVNGGTPVTGELTSTARGISLRLTSPDAGGVMRDAGLVKNGYDGPMEVVLTPTGVRGTYDGTLEVGRLRIRDAPAIADLLGAISVVGLVEQLSGDGLVFDRTEARFRLTPQQVILYQSSATGASLGISLDGTYDLAAKRIDMQGVVSPIYLLNRIGSIFTRPGEGLFGFNFRLSGAAANPDVQVNPLSILTPGMFREIFRRPAPER